MKLKPNAPSRGALEVGPGDYVKIGQSWRKIVSNTAYKAECTPRSWTITTESGRSHSMWNVNRYAKAEDFDET